MSMMADVSEQKKSSERGRCRKDKEPEALFLGMPLRTA